MSSRWYHYKHFKSLLTVERYLVLDMAEMYLLYVYWLLISCVLLLCKYYINRQAHYLLYWYDRGMELDDFYILYISIWTLIVKELYEMFAIMFTILYVNVKCWLRDLNRCLLLHTYIVWARGLIYNWNKWVELRTYCETNYSEDVLKYHKFSYYTISNTYTKLGNTHTTFCHIWTALDKNILCEDTCWMHEMELGHLQCPPGNCLLECWHLVVEKHRLHYIENKPTCWCKDAWGIHTLVYFDS